MGSVEPMLASPLPRGGSLPAGSDWVYEVKWDGARVLADTRSGELRLLSRTVRDVTGTFPELAGLASIQAGVLDGEVVATAGGAPSFGALAERLQVKQDRQARRLAERVPVTYVVFDVLALYGVDLTGHRLTERRATLERLTLPPRCILSPVYDDGTALWAATRREDLEGVVAKRRDSVYRPGTRSRDWVKAAHRRTRRAIVGGWRPESSGSGQLGSVLLGAPSPAGLRFLGSVGSGLTGPLAAELMGRLAPLRTEASPFADDVPPAQARGCTWIDPAVAVEVSYLTRTESGRLRHPVLLGLRENSAPDGWEVP